MRFLFEPGVQAVVVKPNHFQLVLHRLAVRRRPPPLRKVFLHAVAVPEFLVNPVSVVVHPFEPPGAEALLAESHVQHQLFQLHAFYERLVRHRLCCVRGKFDFHLYAPFLRPPIT